MSVIVGKYICYTKRAYEERTGDIKTRSNLEKALVGISEQRSLARETIASLLKIKSMCLYKSTKIKVMCALEGYSEILELIDHEEASILLELAQYE